MFFSFSHIIAWLEAYKYIILFPFAIVEGPIISVIAGFLASLGQMNIVLVYVVVVLGDVVGDAIYYMVGRWGRTGLVDRLGHYVGATKERIARMEQHLHTHLGKTLLFGKWGHTFGAPILLASGAARVPFSRFMFINTLGTLLKSLILVAVGYYFGRAYVQINHYINYGALAITAVVLIIVLGYIFFTKRTNRYFL